MTDIYFIRHAQASFGARDYDQISPLGHRQARILADYFIDEQIYFPVIFTGSKQRQVDTAKIVVSRFNDNGVRISLNILTELDEFDSFNALKNYKSDIFNDAPYLLEDLDRSLLNYKSFKKVFVKVLQWSISGKTETFQIFKDRVRSGIQTVVNESKHHKKVAVVTSGGVLSIAMQMACGLSDAEAIDLVWHFYNTSITLFYIEGNNLELKLDNSVVHLKSIDSRELLTYI